MTTFKDAMLAVTVVALTAAIGFFWWRDRGLRRHLNQAVTYSDSVIMARSDTILKIKQQRDSLLIVAAASRIIYVDRWKTKWDTVRLEITKPDLTLPESVSLLQQADTTITACSVALVDCDNAQKVLLSKDRQDSLLIQDLRNRLELEKKRPTGSSLETKLLLVLTGSVVAGTACMLTR